MYRMMIVDDEERIANSIYDLMDERNFIAVIPLWPRWTSSAPCGLTS